MNKIPDLRFAGFAGEWESSRLSDISIINPKSGKLPETFKYVDLASVTGTCLTNYTILNKEDAPSRAQRLSEKGDIFYQTVRPYQRNNYLFNLDDNDYVFSTGYAQIRTNQEPSFIFAIMQTNKFVNTVMNRTTGTSFPAISTTDLSNIDIKITPNKEEQKKIGDLFKKIDALIEIQEDKVSKMEDFKKSMLQKIFPKKGELVPEIRFKGFTENWELVKLGHTGELSAGGDINKSKIQKGGKYPVIANGDSNSGIVGYYDDEFKIQGPAITISARGNIGTATYRDYNFTPVVRLITLKTNNNYYFMTTLINTLNIIYESTGISQLTIPQIGSYKIKIPSLPEQEKIGQFFKNLDSQIETEKKLLDSYKMMKKSLLQKLFV